MKKYFFLFNIILFFSFGNLLSQSCCGGSFYDIAVLSLNKKALLNVGVNYDNYNGVWNQNGEWRKLNITSWQMKPLLAGAYRFNKYLQAGMTIPYIINRNELPGLSPQASGLGDISVSGRFELLHEFQRYKSGERYKVDTKKPYLAITAGLTFPTGTSDETATTESEITGKGIFSSSLGLSAIKSIIQNKFQIALDLSWQHNFEKSYNKIYNEPLQVTQNKKLGDRFNYGLSFIYLINSWHAASASIGGFRQGAYKIDDIKGDNSDESSFTFSASYSYYPVSFVRITPTFKWFIPQNNFGKNATGSYTYIINFVYYLEY
ncbi:MAG: hypothetical protein NTU73_13755 [Ignavibacteriae bacterium]|nr:hypothetical protein [Ignavibacteriota bacterium]